MTIRFVRWAICGHLVAGVVFWLAVSGVLAWWAITDPALPAEARQWWIKLPPSRCVPASDLARATGFPALADPATLYNYANFVGLDPRLAKWPRRNGDIEAAVVTGWFPRIERFDYLFATGCIVASK